MASLSAYSPYPVKMPVSVYNWHQPGLGFPGQGLPASASAEPLAKGSLSDYTEAGQITQTPQDLYIIDRALTLVGQIRNLPQDEAYIRSLGVNPVFQNGQQARHLIDNKQIRVEFGDMGDSPAHAQWIADQNLIMINQQYRGDLSPNTLCAIAEAIYHEAGHAAKLVKNPATGAVFNQSLVSNNPRDVGDDSSSIQEELDCLALNTLAHRYHEAIYPQYAASVSSSRLLSDGVALYAKLFFDADPEKKALVKRVAEKYGDLDTDSTGHPVPYMTNTVPLAHRVVQYVAQNNPQNTMQPQRETQVETREQQGPLLPSSWATNAFNPPVNTSPPILPNRQALPSFSTMPARSGPLFPIQASPLQQASQNPIPVRFCYLA